MNESIFKTILGTLRKLAGSRKVMLAVISGLLYAGGKLGLHLDADQLLPIVAPLWGALTGVAMEDIGKSKAVIEAGKS
jgi:hypothetical protein